MKYLIILIFLLAFIACENGNIFKVTGNGNHDEPPILPDSTDSYILVIENLVDTLHILRGTLPNGHNVSWDYERFVFGTEIELSLDSIFTYIVLIDSVEYSFYYPGTYYLEIISITEHDPDSLYSVPTNAIIKIKNITQETEYIIDELITTGEIVLLGDSLIMIPRNFQWQLSFDGNEDISITCQSTEMIEMQVEILGCSTGDWYISYDTGSAFRKSHEIIDWVPKNTLYSLHLFDLNWGEIDSIKVTTPFNTLILNERYPVHGNEIFIFELENSLVKKIQWRKK